MNSLQLLKKWLITNRYLLAFAPNIYSTVAAYQIGQFLFSSSTRHGERDVGLLFILPKRILMKTKVALILITILLLITSVLAQKQNSNLFEVVPKKQRKSLQERFDLFLTVNKGKDFNQYYNMLFGNILKIPIQELQKAYEDFHTVSFAPKQVDRKSLKEYEGANWRILGVLKFLKENGKEESKNGIIYAQLRNNEWYFSGVLVTEMVMVKGTFKEVR